MHRRVLLGASLLALAAPVRAEERWLLVTPEEVRLDRAAPPPPKTRGLPPAGAPEIVVDQPDAGRPLHTPLTFRVRFNPAAGAAINPGSFRATYGAIGLDITSRLLQHARMTGQVLAAENVDISSGTHMVTLSIADTAGRTGSRTFRFTVG